MDRTTVLSKRLDESNEQFFFFLNVSVKRDESSLIDKRQKENVRERKRERKRENCVCMRDKCE